MKKFYYKKGNPPLDKTPIILRLDRRHTINVNKDDAKEDGGRYSRATSISSLDQLKDMPTLPRAKTRAVTKSLSEDFLSRGSYATPSVIITETELSSSWLYKNMKAVANSEDESENEAANTSRSMSQPNFSPIMLQDPRLKPVPVPTTPRPEKTSSYICHMAIMVVISICTIGFISTIGGIVYLEVFANRNVAENPTDSSAMNVLDLLHQYKAEDNESTEYSYKAEVNKDLNPESEELGGSIEMEDKQGNTVRILDFGKPPGKELNQFIDNTRTEVKRKKDYSVAFQEKSRSSKDKKSSVVAIRIENDQIKISNNFESNSNEVTINSNQSEQNMTEVANEPLNENSKEFERYLPPRFNQSINSVSDESISFQETSTRKNEDSNLGPNESISDNVSIQPEDHERDAQNDKEKLMEDTSLATKNNHNYKSNELVNTEIAAEQSENDSPEISKLPIPLIIGADKSNNQNMKVASVEKYESENQSNENGEEKESMKTVIEDNSKTLEDNKMSIETDMGNRIDTNNENGESIIADSKEPIKDISSKEHEIFSNRNGDINLADIEYPTVEIKRPVLSSANFSQQRIPQDVTVKKPADIKVSLAEAFKHLQGLDVNNKLPSSRAKLAKTKVKTSQRPRTSLKRNKEEEAMEQLRYLKKLRLLLYDHL